MGLICFKSELLNIILQKNHFLQSVQCDALPYGLSCARELPLKELLVDIKCYNSGYFCFHSDRLAI